MLPRPLAIPLLAPLLLLVSVIGAPLAAVVLAQIDDFQGGSPVGWEIGPAATPAQQPAVLADSGPGGAGDHALFYTSTGSGPGGQMVMFNRIPNQWSGDYLAEGITAIRMDVTNRGATPLILRMGFNVLFGGAGTWFVSTDGMQVDPSADWTTVTFSIAEADLTQVFGSDSYGDVMSSVRGVRILSSAVPNFHGDVMEGVVGIDNIVAIPEPGMIGLLGGAGLLLLRRRRGS
jgi:hypothetical protein